GELHILVDRPDVYDIETRDGTPAMEPGVCPLIRLHLPQIIFFHRSTPPRRRSRPSPVLRAFYSELGMIPDASPETASANQRAGLSANLTPAEPGKPVRI